MGEEKIIAWISRANWERILKGDFRGVILVKDADVRQISGGVPPQSGVKIEIRLAETETNSPENTS